MNVSNQAKDLLDKGNYKALQTLPIDKLLSGFENDQLNVYGFVLDKFNIEQNEDAKVSIDSLATRLPGQGFEDSVSFLTIHDPVVVSSGQIYSRETVSSILNNNEDKPLCPMTRKEIDPNKIIPLPQITYAINLLMLELQLKESTPDLEFELKISGNKIRMLFKDPENLLYSFLGGIFQGRKNNLSAYDYDSYQGFNYSRVWSKEKLELWLPINYFEYDHNNEQISGYIDKILAPLELPLLDDDDQWPTNFKISKLGHREYVTAFKDTLSYKKVAQCMVSFLQLTDKIRSKEPDKVYKDELSVQTNGPIPEARQLGLGMFGTINLNSGNSTTTSAALNINKYLSSKI